MESGMNLVLLYGPPAVGKLTVANELGRLTAFKVFHNHLSISCVSPVFDFGTEPFTKLVKQVRLAVIEEAAREGVDVIFTFVYAHPVDRQYVEEICEVVERSNGTVRLVRLTCDKKVIEQRAASPERGGTGKLDSSERVRQFMERYDLFSSVPGRESLTIDNSLLAPSEVARSIAQSLSLHTNQEGR